MLSFVDLLSTFVLVYKVSIVAVVIVVVVQVFVVVVVEVVTEIFVVEATFGSTLWTHQVEYSIVSVVSHTDPSNLSYAAVPSLLGYHYSPLL